MKKLIAIILCVGLLGIGGNLIFNQKETYDVVTAASTRIPTVSLVSKTTTSITVSWAALTGADGYNVYCNSTKNNSSLVTSTTYTINNLTANTTYTVQVSAVHQGDEGTKSNTLSVTTNPATSSVASAVSSSVAANSSTAVSSPKISSSNTSSKSSATQGAVSSESAVSSQANQSSEVTVKTLESIIDVSDVETEKSLSSSDLMNMVFLVPAGIVLLFILAILILLIVTRKKKDKFF